jgi:hypothetical protein
MTLADAAATFGPTAGFLIYLWLNRPKTESKSDDATALLQSMNEKLVRILTLLEVRK